MAIFSFLKMCRPFTTPRFDSGHRITRSILHASHWYTECKGRFWPCFRGQWILNLRFIKHCKPGAQKFVCKSRRKKFVVSGFCFNFSQIILPLCWPTYVLRGSNSNNRMYTKCINFWWGNIRLIMKDEFKSKSGCGLGSLVSSSAIILIHPTVLRLSLKSSFVFSFPWTTELLSTTWAENNRRLWLHFQTQ